MRAEDRSRRDFTHGRARAEPYLLKRKRAYWRSASGDIRQPLDRSTGQPQERQHSAAVGGTRDRLPPASGSIELSSITSGRSLAGFKANRLPLPWWPRILGTDVSVSCSCGLLHRAATDRACCDDLCSVCSRVWGCGFWVCILPPQPTSPAPGDLTLSNLRNARQWRAFANWLSVSGLRNWPLRERNRR
jgi:hypothetical protein